MVGTTNAPVLAVLTRAPSSGGKTRLFTSLGIATDTTLLEALLLDTLDGSAAPGVSQIVVVTPADACAEMTALVGTVEVMPQRAGDLGERMRHTMVALFGRGASAVAVIGSDLPHVPTAAIATAFDHLTRNADALVLGPATDGGYYLIAARRLPDVFRDITWGSNRVLAQTERAARREGFRVERLADITDVDDEDSLRRAVSSGRAPRTAAWLRARDANPPG